MKKIKIVKFPIIADERGKLSFVETGTNILMPIKRVFSVSIPFKKIRGCHAHKKCTQIIICINGKIEILYDSGTSKKKYILSKMFHGLIIPPKHWIEIVGLEKKSNFIVLCNTRYDKKEYILDYKKYLKIIKCNS